VGHLLSAANDLTLDTRGGGATTGAINDTGPANTPVLRVTGNHVLTLNAGAGIGSLANPMQTDVVWTFGAGTGNAMNIANSTSNNVIVTNTGDAKLTTNLKNLGGGEIRLWTIDGSIDTGSAAVQSGGGQIILNANDAGNALGGNITIGAGGSVVSGGGFIALHAADNITVNSGIASGNGNIEIIAGARDATFITGLLNGPLTLPATETVVDGKGSISLNATVDAGPGAPATRGNIVLISATHDSTAAGARVPLTTAITQGAGGTLRANNLTAVTLRGTGGQFNGGGSIVLNAATPLNSAANVNLFACAESGCPGPLGGAPFTTAPMIAAIAAPPAGLYADGPLFFTSGTTNISGVGTVNDFVFWGSSVLNVTGGTLFGRKLTFESDGDINIDLASQVTDTNVSLGGVLKFVAGHDINYNTPAVATSTFGAAGNPITHGDIQFIAANDIKINNSIYLGNTNMLTLSANQPVSFITPSIASGGPAPNGQPLASSGTGTVTVQAGTATALSDNAAILQAGTIDIGSLLQPVYQLKLLGGTTESLTVATRQVENSDAQITATGALNIFLGAGGLTMTGGTATVTSTATNAAQATAIAGLKGGTIGLNIANNGNLNMTGGTSTAQGGLSALSTDVGADASANIITTGSLTPIITGAVNMMGGSATAAPVGANSAHALASALVKGASIDLIINNNALAANGLALTGGSASAIAAPGAGTCGSNGGVCATANALFSSDTSKTILVDRGNIQITGGTNANADGVNAGANAIAGTDGGNLVTLATALTVTATTGQIRLTAGNEYVKNGGKSAASAIFQSTGGIKLSGIGPPTGIVLSGAPQSGLYQNLGSSGTVIALTGLAPPVQTFGDTSLGTPGVPAPFGTYTANIGIAFVLSGAPPSNLDPLQAGLLSSLNLIKVASPAASSSSSSSSKPNYCK
jgi:hypothetical protein